MSTNARVVRHTKGKPVLLEVPTDHACVVLEPSGAVDLGLLPEGENEGATLAQAILLGLLDPEFAPELRALLARVSQRHFGTAAPVMQ